MKLMCGIFLLSFQMLWASSVFESDALILVLNEDSTYLMYPKEKSLALRFSGESIRRNDSLIFITHSYEDESIILAIYQIFSTHLNLLYSQVIWETILPENFYIQKRLHSNGVIYEDYYWDDYANGSYILYAFSPERWIRSIAHYAQGQKHGKELIFFNNAYGAIKEEKSYRNGLLSGKCYTYEPDDDTFLRVKISAIAVYKSGELKRFKTPATPLVFYTSHF